MKLAPAGVLRAAAWPLEALDGFGGSELAARTRDTRRSSAADAELERAYRAGIERERSFLWARAMEDSWFDKALALSSPSACTRIRGAMLRRHGPRNRAMRLAEHTLYRYLARAAGRATPHGLWAGVTEVGFASSGGFEERAGRLHFTADLRPFQCLIRQLAGRPQYTYRATWQLNPTLDAAPGGGWTFFRRLPDGRVEHRALDPHPEVAVTLAALAALPPMNLDRLAAEVAHRLALPIGGHRRLLHLFEAFAAGGMLVGGMDLPARFETPWEALERAAEDLDAEDRSAWSSTVDALRAECRRLSADGGAMSANDFVARLGAARRCLMTLAQTLGLAPDMVPPQVLRCDLALPWRMTLDGAQRGALLAALGDYERQWLHGASVDAAMRAALRARLTKALAGGKSLGEGARLMAAQPPVSRAVWPSSQALEEPEARARLRTWEHCLDAPEVQAALPTAIGAAPYPVASTGCLYVELSGGFTVTVRSVADIPTLASARFAAVLEGEETMQWIRAQVAKDAQQTGVAPLELRTAFPDNPNVLASPALLQRHVDPWSASPDALALAGARLDVDARSGRAVLKLAGSTQSYAVISLGVADLQSRDPVAQLLLWTGFHESPGRNQRAVDVPIVSELASTRYTPRVLLERGAVLRRRRSLLSTDLGALLRSRGCERFRLWQDIASRLDWPEQLQVSAPGFEPLRMHRDSPLALEALFKGLRSEVPFVVVEEATPGLPIPGRGTHVVELAVPFCRA